MTQPVRSFNADQNLLFGIMALQINFIDRDTLVHALNAWVLEKQKSLAEILVERNKLTRDQFLAINGVIEQHLKLHEDDPEKSLSAVKTKSDLRENLLQVEDIDVLASVTKLDTGTIEEETQTFNRVLNDESRYIKLRHHADGGQGRVFVARDTELNREIALKELKDENAQIPDRQQRMILEAEITGGLEHPGIVPVYGLGAYADGRPYYAMRFIRGDNLSEAIKDFHRAEVPNRDSSERSLAFRQLLRRFIDVCNAVDYAHSRGVVHRDLKPKNIMLGKFGETLVVDWGLAKVGTHESVRKYEQGIQEESLLQPASEGQFEATIEGAQVGTPPFMSPEQANGRIKDLDHLSDIYSLGSSLYTLLTGKNAYIAQTKDAVMAMVGRGQFTPPKQVKPNTPAALDAICCKAMSLQPKDRYASALALAADVEHWLADEPATAYIEPWSIRLSRWSRRHRTAVASAAVFLVCTTIALGISTTLISAEQRRTESQKKIAEDNYRLSKRQSLEIFKLMESSEPEFARVPFFHERRAELLKSVTVACRRFLIEEPNNHELMVQVADTFRFAANFERLTYRYEEAESHYREAISLQKQLSSSRNDAESQLHLCEVLRDFASLKKDRGQLNEAFDSVDGALQISEELFSQNPRESVNRRNLALLLLNHAFLESRRGRSRNGAKSAIDRSIALFRELMDVAAEERHPYEPLLLASALNQRAIMEREGGDFDQAQKTHAETTKLLIEIRDSHSASLNEADVVHFLAECQLEQCQTWAKIDKPNFLANAEKNAGVAINNLAKLAMNYSKLPTYQESFAKAYRVRGDLRIQGKNFAGAREHFLAAKEKLLELVNSHDQLPSLRCELAKTYGGLGTVARELGDEDATRWLISAKTEIMNAIRISPDDAQFRSVFNDISSLLSDKIKAHSDR